MSHQGTVTRQFVGKEKVTVNDFSLRVDLQTAESIMNRHVYSTRGASSSQAALARHSANHLTRYPRYDTADVILVVR